MTAASQLPPEFARRTDWTVDDLAGLPPDLNYELINVVAVVPVRYAGVSPVRLDGALLVVEVISQSQIFRGMVDKERADAKARIPTYWIIEPTTGQINLIERLLGPDGDYHYGEATSDVYTTDRPWKVMLDLPALSARHKAMREHADLADHQ